MSAAIDKFRVAIRNAGLDHAGPIEADGKLRRFKAKGDKSRDSWYVLYPGPPAAGAFGCWKRGISKTWCDKSRRRFTDAEWRQIHERWERAEKERVQAEEARRTEARKAGASIMEGAEPAEGNGYLATKQTLPQGELRQQRGDLIVPLRDAAGELHSLQFIRPDGSKKFLA